MDLDITKEELIGRLEGFSRYFKKNISNDRLFIPETHVAKEVCQLIQSPEMTKYSIQQIVRQINEMNKKKHYDGSGWHDFKQNILWLVNFYEIEAEFDED